MAENAIADIIWEDNPDTPIDSSGLSSSFDYQSESKFLYFTDNDEDYESWADHVINLATWPLEGDPNWDSDYIGKVVYNKFDQRAQTAFEGSGGVIQWDELASPYRKILKISAGTKITLSYIEEGTGETKYESFFFDKDQIFSVDDLLNENDLSTESFYSVYLYHRYDYGDRAALKIINSIYDSDDSVTGWSKSGINTISPSGYNVISTRKIGGFRTTSSGQIDSVTLWDLSTYRYELTVDNLKIINNGVVEEFEAKHVPIDSTVGNVQFSSDNVQDALVETREFLNELSSSFYTNRRGGVQLRYAFGRRTSPAANPIALNTNEISLMITSGFVDVSGGEIKIENDIFLANPDVEISINDGAWMTGRTLGPPQTDGSGNDLKIYAGVWRLFIDELGRILVKEQQINLPNNSPIVWNSSNSYWQDPVNGARCIGKFSVGFSGSTYYIDKMSITDSLDINPPIGTLFTFHGTMCPDGLLPCDGRWHDVTGRDTDSYTLLNLPAMSTWGQSWYEETPNLMGKTLKMSPTSTQTNSGGKFDITTGAGGSIDVGLEGGDDDHYHSYPHSHDKGTLSIVQSGEHNHPTGDFTVDPPTSSEVVQVDTVPSGTGVASGGHVHQTLITNSGEHVHSNGEFQGNTGQTSGTAANTQTASSWPPYKEVLICIKK